MKNSSFETDDTDDLARWFEARWREVGRQPDQPRSYCETWTRPKWARGEVDPPNPSTQVRYKEDIVFVQEGERPPPRLGPNLRRKPAKGSVVILGESHHYDSATAALKLVLGELHKRDKAFLEKCFEHDQFARGKSHYIAEEQTDLGSDDFQSYAKRLESGWYFSVKTKTQQKWRLVEAAAEVAKLSRPKVEGEWWQAEEGAKNKVGF